MSDSDNAQRNGKLNLSHLTPEAIAGKTLETPTPPEKEIAKLSAQERPKQKWEQACELRKVQTPIIGPPRVLRTADEPGFSPV